jgi:hypothetical protein
MNSDHLKGERGRLDRRVWRLARRFCWHFTRPRGFWIVRRRDADGSDRDGRVPPPWDLLVGMARRAVRGRLGEATLPQE